MVVTVRPLQPEPGFKFRLGHSLDLELDNLVNFPEAQCPHGDNGTSYQA